MALGLSLFRGDALFAKWQDDWRSVQRADGNLPFTAPTYVGGGGPAWSGIVVSLAWEQWRRGGDVRLLQRAWPAIERWLGYLETQTRDGSLEPWCVEAWAAPRVSFLGDWLPPGAGLIAPRPDDKSRYFNDAYHVACVRRAATIAALVQEPAKSRQLAARADELAASLHARWFRPQRGCYVADRQVNHLLALFAQLGDEPLRAQLLARLSDELATKRHLETGLHGTWLLFEELLARGRADLLITLALQRDFPSWGWFLDQGLTTFPEDWSAELSRLHACWLPIGRLGVEGVAGMRPDPSGDAASAGWRRYVVQPTFADAIPWAEATQPTPHGVARVAWKRDDHGVIALEVDVPIGTTAQLVLPEGTLAGDDIPADRALCSGAWRWRFTPTPPSPR
jgi:alpha-L-rhamnosidase